MVDRDVVIAKIATIERCIARIEEVRSRNAALKPIDIEDIVLVNLQRATQAAIDIAAHVVSTENFGLPDTVAGEFTVLENYSVISSNIAERMRKMVGFCNIAVHDYQVIDPKIVKSIILNHLDDIREFTKQITTRFFGSENGSPQ